MQDRVRRQLLIIYAAKALRMIAFGGIAVILAIFLLHRNFSTLEVGAVFSLTLIQDAVLTTLVSLLHKRFGMRNILLCSSAAMIICGIALMSCNWKWLLVAALVFGIISPAGYEGGPFSPLEQAIISGNVGKEKLTKVFSTYNLIGFGGAAIGALLAGLWMSVAGNNDYGYNGIFAFYAVSGVLLLGLYAILPIGKGLIAAATPTASVNLKSCNKDILRLSALQGLDAFGGGFVAQSLISYWFIARFNSSPEFLGYIFFGTNILAAISFMLAPLIAGKIGMLKTMVFTHLPCSLSLCLMAFMPTEAAAAALLLVRSLFSSMDIPVRQAYAMLIVAEEERPYAASITTAARAIAQGLSPALSGWALLNAASGLSFIFAGSIKSVYDLLLFACFKNGPRSIPDQSQIKTQILFIPLPAAKMNASNDQHLVGASSYS